MSEHTGRFDWVLKACHIALILTLVVLAAMLTLTTALLIFSIKNGDDWVKLLILAVCILAEVMAAGWALVVYGLVHGFVGLASSSGNTAAQLGRQETLLEDMAGSSRKLLDLATLSNEAKSVLYRDRESAAMRELMHGLLVAQDFASAEALIKSLEQKPAYAAEAAIMKEELANTRKATMEEQVELAIRRVEAIIANGDWARATREAQRIMEAMPDNPKIATLPQRIEAARTRQKRDLLQAYGELVRKNDIDGSIELLKKLDRYLTPQEAAALQDSARGVFRAKLHNMGVQFAIRVAEGQWNDAIATGEEIVNNYPNSRMAYEVRSKLEQLHQRAAGGTPTSAAPNTPPASAAT